MSVPAVLGIVSFKIFPARMGGQKSVACFYSHLARHTKVVLAVSKDNPVSANTGYAVQPFLYHHKRGLANLRYVFRLRKLIKQENIGVVFIEHSYLGWLGILLQRLTHKPFFIHSHNIEAHRFRDMHKSWWRIYQWYERWVHRQADHSFFITQEDKDWVIQHWQLDPAKCTVITYGTDLTTAPSQTEKLGCRQQLIRENNLDPATTLFLFNGTLDYLPNTDALRIIISELLPLLQTMNFPFRIIVCGNQASSAWEKVLQSYPFLLYKGFVDDIDLYLNGADCFINPVTLGSGIKIKLVDALSYNQFCISTESGAKGIPKEAAGTRLVTVQDYDWPAFVQAMRVYGRTPFSELPPAFYQFFHWDVIIQKALLSLPTA